MIGGSSDANLGPFLKLERGYMAGGKSGVRETQTSVGPQSGTEGILTPQDLWGVYDDPGAAALTNASGDSSAAALQSTKVDFGQGQTIGIFGEGETSSVVAQLRLFEQAMGFPKVPVRVVHTEGGPDSEGQHRGGRVVPGFAGGDGHGPRRFPAQLLLR